LTLLESEARSTLEGILDKLGIKSGDRIMLGIDMSKLPLPSYEAALSIESFREREQKWCQFVFDILLNHVGSSGTIIVPTFTYSCGKPDSVFNAEFTPSENGPFTEFFRTQPDAVRSLHPIFSLTGIGQDAEKILGRVGRSAFGSMSPYSRFAANNVKFLCLGVELKNSITYIHHLEQSYGCPHRYNKSFDTTVICNGKKIKLEWYAFVGYRGLNYTSDIASLQDGLKNAGCLVKEEWEECPNHLVEISDVDRIGYELLTNNSCAFTSRRLKFSFDEVVDNGLEKGNNSSTLLISVAELNPLAQ